MSEDRKYSPVEVCQIFAISKSTLLRWEREGLLVGIKRDVKTGQREYSQSDIQVISQRLESQLSRQYDRSAEAEDTVAMMRIHEVLALRKIIQGDLTGLDELTNIEMSSENILHLLQIAKEQYEPVNPTFCNIIRVVWEQCKRISTQQ
jgi:DNA-binding transcriptional MerR regulator